MLKVIPHPWKKYLFDWHDFAMIWCAYENILRLHFILANDNIWLISIGFQWCENNNWLLPAICLKIEIIADVNL